MTTLKPCPFCGGIGTLWSIDQCDTAYAVCQDCGARTVDYKHAEEAIAVWNRRAEQNNTPLTLDELREMDGEPVWVQGETVFGTQTAGYKILVLNESITGVVRFIDGRDLVADNYGKTWLAYRYKPKEVQG